MPFIPDFQRIVDEFTDGVLLVDESDHVLYANLAAHHLFGRPAPTLVGLSLGSLVQDERTGASSLAADAVQQRRAAGAVATVVERARRNADGLRPDGTCVPIVVDDTPLQGARTVIRLITVRDETASVLAERALDAARAVSREAVLQSPVAMVVVRAPDARVLLANHAAASLLGLPATAFEERDPVFADEWDVLDPDGRLVSLKERPLYRALMNGVVATKAAHAVRSRADGHVTRVAISAGPVRDASGRIIGAVSVLEPRTDSMSR